MRRQKPAVAHSSSANDHLLVGILLAAVISCACGYLASQFVSLTLPLEYDGDTLLVWMVVKTLAMHFWAFNNESMGLPSFMEWGHFPMSFVGQLAALKAVLLTGANPITAINIYFLITFAAAAASATWVMHRVQLSTPWAALGGIVYSLLPYHFLRAPGHLFLAGYYMVPLGIYVLLRLDAADALDEDTQRRLMVMSACATFFNDIYYTFFLGYLIGAAGVLRFCATRRWQPTLATLRVLMAMFISCLLSMLPALWTLWRPGAEPSPLVRPANDSENYGLKLIQMLLPAPGHQTSWLKHTTDAYTSTAPLVTENQTASLGLVGTACLLAVVFIGLISLFRRPSAAVKPPWLATTERFAVFIALAFLFGTIGGLGAVLSYTTTTFIRCTNRIVVVISFFAIAGGMTLLQRAVQSIKWRSAFTASVICTLFLVLAFDVTDVDYYPNRHTAAQSYKSDQDFFEKLERNLPDGAAVFQLPFVTFIEGGFQKRDYLQALPYLHSQKLKFSFGAFRGTSGDTRNRRTAALCEQGSPDQIKRRLLAEGFDALLLNAAMPMHGYPQSLQHVVQALGEPRLASPSRHFVLFGVSP